MSPFDGTVGGIASLMPGHGDVDQPGAFEFAQRSEPVVKMARGGYSPQAYEDFYQDFSAQNSAPADSDSTANTNIVNTLQNAGLQSQGSPFAGQTIHTNVGDFNYDDIVNQVNARYAEGKDAALAVKSALQLGIPEDVILTLPGVDANAFAAGKNLISSGAFAPTATGTAADTAVAAQPGTALYNARIAAGLDAYGYPATQVAMMKAAGTYKEPVTQAPPPYAAPAPAPYAAPAPAPAVSPAPAPATQNTYTSPLDALNAAKTKDLSKDLYIYNTGSDSTNIYDVAGNTSVFGNYNITPIGTLAPANKTDYEGNQYVDPYGGTALTGYNVSTQSKTDKGIPIVINYEYGLNNDLRGYSIDYRTGNDSGVYVQYDATGRPISQYGYDRSESWRKPVAIGLGLLGAMVGLPEIGTFLTGASGAAAGAIGGAALGGATAATLGAEGSDILKAAGKGAVTGGLGTALNDAQLLKSVGIDTTLTQGTNALGQNIANVTGLDQAGDAYSAIRDAVAGGSKAVVQQGLASLLTGQKFDPTVSFIGGAASNAVNKYLLSNDQFEKLPENLKNAVTGAITAGALGKNPTAAAVNAFVSNLFKDTSAIKTLSGNPGGTKAILDTLSPLTEVGGADLNDYINELLSMADLSVPEKTQLMNDIETLIIQNSRYKYGDDFVDNLLSDVFKQTGGKIGETVDVTGGKFKKSEDEVIQNLIDQYTTPGQTVDVTGKYLDKGTAEDQTVDVTGKYLDKIADQTVDVTDKYLDKGDQQVTVQDKKIVTEPDDITNQKVEVTDSTKDLKELDTVGGIDINDLIKDIPGKLVVPDKTTPGTTSKTTTPGTTTTTATPSWSFTPVPTQEGKMLPYQLANVFYGGALEYGPGAESMASPSDFQGQKRKAQRAMELALDGQGGENEANNAADAILAMAEQDPGATVDELMNIVQGGRYA